MGSKLQAYQLGIFAILFVGYACYAYNRKSVSFALPRLMEEGLDKSQAGLIISSQNIAYAISKFIGGVLSDRISSRLLFSTGIAVSGVATILFSSVSSIYLYVVFWFLNGFAQGCGWPACGKMLRKWYSPTQFGTYWSVLSASANISGGLSPFFSTFLIVNYGWRFSLVVAGSVSVVIGVLSLIFLVNSPEDIGLPSFDKTDSKKQSSKDASAGKETLYDLLRSPLLWLLSFCYMVVFCGKTSAVDWGQMYLIEDRKHTNYVGSAFTSSVETGGFFGGIVAGYLTDVATRAKIKYDSKSGGNVRMSVAVYFMAGVMCCLHLLYFYVSEISSQLWISTLGFVLGLCFYGPIAIYGVVASESAPSHLSGTAHAIVALAANVGAIISGLPFSYVAKYYNWSTIFLLLELATGFTVLVMLICRNITSTIGKRKED